MFLFRKSSRRYPLSLLLFVCALAASGWGISRASASRAVRQPATQPSSDALLNADGKPRFVPAAPDTVINGWDTQFSLPNGLSGEVSAMIASGTDIYVSGGLGAVLNAPPTNFLLKFDTLTQTWTSLGTVSADGAIRVMALSGSDLYVGGFFTTVDVGGTNVPANNVAKLNLTTGVWSALGTGGGQGVNGGVYALALSGSDLYVGGFFLTANVGGATVSANRLARFNTATGIWSALGTGGGNGVNSTVIGLAVSGNDLYVGGSFATVNVGGTTVTANGVARFNTLTGVWSALGNGGGQGIGNVVQVIALSGNDLYVGGNLSLANIGGVTVPVNNLAKFNTATGIWSAVGAGGGNGVDADVSSLLPSGDELYVGGGFTTANVDGATVGANRIAKVNTSTGVWSALGTGGGNGVSRGGGAGGEVSSVAMIGSLLYVAGSFTSANEGGSAINVSAIAKFDTATSFWSGLTEGTGKGLNDVALAVAVNGTDVYVGGIFSFAGSVPVNGIAKFDTLTNTWSALGTGGGKGVDGTVQALAVSGGDLYVAGDFTMANVGGATVNVNNVAKVNLATGVWSALGTGGGNGVNSPIRALLVSGGNLYVGGLFTTANVGSTPVSANRVAKFNLATSVWSALGTGGGNGLNSSAQALAVSGGNLYVGGTFATANVGGTTVSANNIARVNLTTGAWSVLGTGGGNGVSGGLGPSFVQGVYALAANGSDLYVGGLFNTANTGGTTVNANYIAKVNLATGVWSALGNGGGNGLNLITEYPAAAALALNGNDLYVAGGFTMANIGGTTVNANSVAKFNTATGNWSALADGGGGNGVNYLATSLGLGGNDVFVSGLFSTAGDNKPSANIARFHTNTAPTIAAQAGVSRQKGSPASNGQIATVNDLESGAGGVTVTVTSANPSNGITISNIVNAGGTVTADVVASCTATNASFTLTATDGDGATATATLNVTATSNTAPVLNYGSSQAVTLGGSVTVSPSAGPSDNGTISSIVVQSQGTYTGSISVNNITGEVSISNAKPLGTHTINIRATDNCGATTTVSFTLTVNCITSLTVNNLGDGTDALAGNGICETATGNGQCTLRAALQEANALPTCLPLTINIAVTGTINAGSILPLITHQNLSIVGPGANLLTIDGVNKTHQMFRTGGSGVTLQISGLTITNGGVPAGNNNASAIEFNSSGGQLTLNGCALLNNGGSSQIYSNLSGGITINNSIIGNNPDNTGIRIDRTPLTLINSTITGNAGSGILFPSGSGNATVTLLNSTLTNGIDLNVGTSGSLTLKNSIIATTISLGSGVSLISQGNNLCSNATLTPTAAGDLINTNPMLSALGDYGGPTPTRALLPGSPAINAGASSGAPATDQRGIARVGNVDIGAFESRGFTLTATSGSNQTTPVYTAFPNPLSLTVSSPFGEPVNGGQVTFTPPASGASCIFDNNPATISNGVVNARASANGVFGGPYNVGASTNSGNFVSFQSLTNTGPVISSVVLLRTAGAGSSNSTIAQVSDPAQAANTLAVTVNGASSATVNGVTVSGLSISAGGAVTANVAAAPDAISADFSVRVTNSQNYTATALLTVIVVSPACDGGSGTAWPQHTKLVASDGLAGDDFGISLAISGDTAIVGANADSITAGSFAGSAYVYTRSGTTWTQQQKLTADDGAAGDAFGCSVAISGDTIIVGACGDDTTAGSGVGSAYVFTRSGTTWTQQQKLTAADGAAFDSFGISVAINGDTAIVGAFAGDTTAGTNAGSAYVFTRNGTTWTQHQKLTAADGAAEDLFGASLAISGDTAIVGAYLGDTTAGTFAGSAYVFTRSGATWTQRQKLTAADGAASDLFGISVAISGDTVIVGSYLGDTTAGINAGSAYVFTRSGATWTQQQKLMAADGAANDFFGGSVAISGETVFVGAWGDGTALGVNTGSTYIFARNCLPSLATQTGLARQQGTAASNSIIATVSDTETAAGSLIVTATTIPAGLSVTNLVNTNGTISADIATSCAAATGDNIVVLTVADGNGGTTTANLIVNVTINTAPAVAYPASVNVLANGSTTVNVSTATDNGSITQYQILSVTPPLTVAPTVNASGTVSITNAGPAGNHTITVRATDNCGANTDVSFILIVGCPTVTINQTSLPNGFVGISYNQSLTAAGGTAPYSFAVSAGALPEGVTLSSGGALSGTPTTQASFSFTIRATDANGCFGEQAFTVLVSGDGLMFYPLPSPVRLLDTRTGFSGCTTGVGALAAGSTRTQAARTACSTIPANATAIIGNITVVPSGPGYLTLFPSDATQPTVANSNFTAGEVTNNFFTVGLGTSGVDAGAFKIFTSAATDVIIDVTGYYAPPAAGGLFYHPLPSPVRLVETRAGQSGCFQPAQLQGTNNPNANPNLDLPVQGRGPGLPSPCNSIPSDAVVLVGNATTVLPNAPLGFGYLTIYPSDAPRPTVASSNYATNDVINGPFAVKLGADGKFKIYTFSTTDLVVDISGYYSASPVDANGAGLLFSPLPKPMRLLETRADFPGFPLTGCYRTNAPIAGQPNVRTQPVWGTCSDQPITIPNTARAIAGNVTAINPAAAGFLTFFPGDVATAPTVATSNYPFPVTFGYNRHYFVGLGSADGTFKALTQFSTDLIVDVAGYFAP